MWQWNDSKILSLKQFLNSKIVWIILVGSKFSILGFIPRLVGIDTLQQEFKRSLHLEIGFLGATLLEHLSLHIFYCLLWKTRWTNWRLLFYSSYHTLCIILCNNSSPFWKDPCCAFLQWNRYVLKVSGDFIFFSSSQYTRRNLDSFINTVIIYYYNTIQIINHKLLRLLFTIGLDGLTQTNQKLRVWTRQSIPEQLDKMNWCCCCC